MKDNSLKIEKDTVPFTQVANDVLNDPKISFKAKGIYAYLYSKPDGWNFSIDRIKHQTKEDRKAVNSGLKELEDNGYLIRKRQSTGRVIYLLKSQMTKMDTRALLSPDAQNGQVPKRPMAETVNISNKDIKAIKSNSNKDIAAQKSPPFSWQKYLKAMDDHPARHIQVIAHYFQEKKISFGTLKEAQVAIRRHLRAAKDVAAFPDEKIVRATESLRKEFPDYTVETILKKLTK